MIPQAEVGLRKVGVVQGGVPPALHCDWTPERREQLLIKAPLTNRIAGAGSGRPLWLRLLPVDVSHY